MSRAPRDATVDSSREELSMSHLLHRLGQVSARHPWRTILGWIAGLVVIVILAGSVGGAPVDNFRLEGSEAQRGLDTLVHSFPSEAGSSAYVVVRNPDLTNPAFARLLGKFAQRLGRLDHVVA